MGAITQPGSSGTLARTFQADDQVRIASHQPGHDADGVKITVTVS